MTDLKPQVTGLNQFLSVIYKSEIRLSNLLETCGFNAEQIANIKAEHLEQFVKTFTEKLKKRMLEFSDGDRLQPILFKRFGLDGNPSETLQIIGDGLDISRERIRQLEKKALRLCRHKKHIQNLESDLRDSAQNFL